MNMMRRQLVAFQTIATKEITRFLRIWTQTFFPSVITTTLYFIIFGNLIGSRIGEMEGFPYIDFIVPGLILMSIITGSYTNSSSSFFSAKFQGFIEEIVVSPSTRLVVLLGYLSGGMARGLLTGALVTLVALAFADLHVHSVAVLLSVAVLTSLLFSLGGLINGIFAKSFDDIYLVPTFLLTPLTYLGGIFYSIRLLPEFWQTLSLANPILYMINAFRYGFLGVSDIELAVSFTIIIVCIVLLALLAMRLLERDYDMRT